MMLDLRPVPNTTYCDESQEQQVMEIFVEILDNTDDSIKLQNQENFLQRVLEWFLATDETVDVTLVTDIIRLLVK